MQDLYLGLMSGTSLDALDIALCRFEPEYQLLHSISIDLPSDLKKQIEALTFNDEIRLDQLMLLERDLACFASEATLTFLAQYRINPTQIEALGYHGQTLRHNPSEGCTYQAGDPNIIAEMVGIDVIADLRRRDLAAGGEGAPLVPAFHQFLTQALTPPYALLNLGGIANLSIFQNDHSVLGFDTGPANTLLDQWIAYHQNEPFDRFGKWAQHGSVKPELLERMLQDSYFQRDIPKSTGRERFNLHWLNRILDEYDSPYSAQDVQSTLSELTAKSVADALLRHTVKIPSQLIVCGGGALNADLITRLNHHLPATDIKISDELGWPADSLEAAAFAWLAYAFKQEKMGNIPSVTGAFGERRLGALYPK